MSKLSRDEIASVAKLARIELNEDELNKMTIDVSSILDFVEKIKNTDTSDIEITSQVTGLTDIWREDEIKKSSISSKDILAGAPETIDGYVKVKKVL